MVTLTLTPNPNPNPKPSLNPNPNPNPNPDPHPHPEPNPHPNPNSVAFEKLKAKFGGRYHSLTPGHPDHITNDEYNALVKGHKMFKDMSDDSYLADAGIASDWPVG